MSRKVVSAGLVIASLMIVHDTAQADEYVLSNGQRITCTRGLNHGKLSTAACRSYAYLFNRKTSEYYRCRASVSMTRDPKEVISVQTDGGCKPAPRIFETDSEAGYMFDAAETELANTNSFFGLGGHVVWASDRGSRKVRSCITLPTGMGPDITRCVDMTFE